MEMDRYSMTNESVKDTIENNYPLLQHAEGTIEAGFEQQERLDEVTELLVTGEFHTLVEDYGMIKCIDGRPGGYGLYPNTAGGTETLLVADDLTTKRFADETGTTVNAYRNLIHYLEEAGEMVGGHGDNHAEGAASGCGANDKLEKIYAFMVRSADILRELAEKLGVVVDDITHDTIIANAAARTQFSTGAELLSVLLENENAHHEELLDVHNEVVAVINTQPDTSLDRQALADHFGDDYQAFNVDVWAFSGAAASIAELPEEISAKVVAMVYYNLATAHVLCGKGMRVVVL